MVRTLPINWFFWHFLDRLEMENYMFCFPGSFNKYLSVQPIEHGFSWLSQYFCQSAHTLSLVQSCYTRHWNRLLPCSLESDEISIAGLKRTGLNQYWTTIIADHLLNWHLVDQTSHVKQFRTVLLNSILYKWIHHSVAVSHAKLRELLREPGEPFRHMAPSVPSTAPLVLFVQPLWLHLELCRGATNGSPTWTRLIMEQWLF